MKFFDYSVYEPEFQEGGNLENASDFEVINFLHEKLIEVCIEALKHSNREVVKEIINSKEDLSFFLDSMSEAYGNDIFATSAATSILIDVSMSLIKAYPYFNYKLTDEDVIFILQNSEYLNTPSSFVINIRLHEVGFDDLDGLTSKSHNYHSKICAKDIWPEDKLAVLYLLGMPLDASNGSVGNYKTFSRKLLSCPILNGANKAFNTCGRNLKINSTVIDASISDIYQNNPLLRVIEAQTGLHFGFIDPSNDEALEGGDYQNCVDPNYIKIVNELALEAKELTADKLINGHGGNSDEIHDNNLAISCLNSIEDVSSYLANRFHGRDHYPKSVIELLRTQTKAADITNSLVVESHTLLSGIERIDALAENVKDENEQMQFLEAFRKLFALRTDYVDDFTEQKKIFKPNYQNAFVDFPFDNVRAMALSRLNHIFEPSHNSVALTQFIYDIPLPLACQIVSGIEDETVFKFYFTTLHERLFNGAYANDTHHGMDIIANELARLYALAEQRMPGIGKSINISRINPLYGFDKDDLMARFIAIIDAEKHDALVTESAQSDMSFVANEMRI
jgi:hypothetical protein